ncbi:AfsR/SARP family transcriptional regulator [Nocardioides pacificus]
MASEYWIRIFLLGDFFVLRRDGATVSDHEWRTHKNRDLLRILALRSGQPTPSTGLTDKLWADVPQDRARASLGTALSHLRGILGPQCIQRQGDHVTLSSAWVDVVAFEAEARQVHHACQVGDFNSALALAQSASHLYRGTFHAHHDDSEWAMSARAALVRRRHDLSVDAAEAALALGLWSDSLDHARQAVHLDPCTDRAQRVLMRAHASAGEIASALRAFDIYRCHLAHEHNATPSAETLELHLRLLRGDAHTER